MERHGLTKILDNRCVCSCGDQFERLEGPAEIGEPPLTVRPRQPIEALHQGRWVCLRLPRYGAEIWPGYNSRGRPSLSLKIRGRAELGATTISWETMEGVEVDFRRLE